MDGMAAMGRKRTSGRPPFEAGGGTRYIGLMYTTELSKNVTAI